MKSVYKYPFNIVDEFTIEMPVNASFLRAEVQEGCGPCMWVLVAIGAPIEKCTFRVFGTGHSIPDAGLSWLTTFQDTPYVWHLFWYTSQFKETK